ncbi:M3 family oligoendopeptidase [Enterococcus malodoratus]|uniref:M3 family oligoendopeptidase n=1 Tax=Enterococcus malodoratus TaxID=71451 RepID=UPI002073F8CC|nr:M3 family oligoendopeptidase [Enterococcus malodoratus]
MIFSDFTYERPDLNQYETTFNTANKHFPEANSYSDAKTALQELNRLRGDMAKNMKLAYIRHSIDTSDNFYRDENDFWDHHEPLVNQIHNHFYESLLSSPFRTQLEADFPATLFLFAEDQLRLLDDSVIELKQQENEMVSQYIQVIASAELEFEGKKRTLSELSAFFTEPNREIRKAAHAVYESFFVTHEQEIDEIFDQLVTLRHQQAQKLGFANYVEYGDRLMNRWSYDRQQLHAFRQFIVEEVVPINQKLYKRQQERLGIDTLFHYDLPLVYPTGNPRPQGNRNDLVQKAQAMYHELSDETGNFFDQMFQQELMDLDGRPGKQSGGYCEFIDEVQMPFIFANFNGTSDDVDVLTHETGHAFQSYLSRWITEPELVFPTSDTAEIHSMSMEFLTWPWMNKFFGTDSEKYKFAHLSSALQFLPYGALVDHFQEEVYLHPEWSAADRKNCWRELEKRYCPERDYQSSEALARGIYWYRQGHIFEVPFYYIDYTLAQVCALQFWQRSIVEQDPTTWEDYLAICRIGGSKTFLETVQLGHLSSPFDHAKMTALLAAVDQYLTAIPETELN